MMHLLWFPLRPMKPRLFAVHYKDLRWMVLRPVCVLLFSPDNAQMETSSSTLAMLALLHYTILC